MDTICYRLHNLDRISYKAQNPGEVDLLHYQKIISALENLEGKGKAVVRLSEDLQNRDKLSLAMLNRKVDVIYFFNYSAEAYSPSYTNDVNIFYERYNNSLKFEFSIPKMLYGNSVTEVLPTHKDHKYYRYSNRDIHSMVDYWFDMIHKIFEQVITDLTGNQFGRNEIIWSDVEISRLDICYNQMFDSFIEKRTYFDSLKRIGAKRINDAKYHPDVNGLWFQTENYHFKIYDKGVDFKRTFPDLCSKAEKRRKEKRNIHEAVQQTIINYEKLQTYADRLLRYELEFTNKTMSLLYNSNIKKSDNKQYKEIEKLLVRIFNKEQDFMVLRTVIVKYTDGNNIYNSPPNSKKYSEVYYLPQCTVMGLSEDVFDYIKKTNENISIPVTDTYQKHREQNIYQVVNTSTINRIRSIINAWKHLKIRYGFKSLTQAKQAWKFISRERSRHHRFMLGCEQSYTGLIYPGMPNEQNMLVYAETEEKQLFTKELFHHMVEWFIQKFFLPFQLNEFPDDEKLERKLNEYNERIKRNGGIDSKGKKMRKISKVRIKLVFAALKSGNYKDLERCGLNRVTLWRAKKDIAKILDLHQFENFEIKDVQTNCIKDPKNLYKRHYEEMMSSKSPIYIFLANQYPLNFVKRSG